MSQIDPCGEERARLSRRLATISDKTIKRELNLYRKRLTKHDAIEQRGCGTHYIRLNGKHSYEATDLMALLHQFLDEKAVDHCYS